MGGKDLQIPDSSLYVQHHKLGFPYRRFLNYIPRVASIFHQNYFDAVMKIIEDWETFAKKASVILIVPVFAEFEGNLVNARQACLRTRRRRA